ncbi:glycerophosphodiester phosphodiesterase [Fodinisporobacter ferrooxydans]|uniref:Glycerophosphodiester phosphodiesterase n=1 Tax=Fodinisporobacter ferrooxydans TaxID=2901836 RepID=A0ABY4CQK9_9BACL|nr:glycerophosphodiester phosphodiesterase [Alicyclobacillaceae bacterium MYW30-H2]
MPTHRPLILAHRGFSAKAPENTLAAFEAARLAGADGIELDVQCTKDGEVVVIHDERVDRTTNGRGWVKDFTYQELQGLDAGSWFHNTYRGQTVPRFIAVLQWAKQHRLLLNIELKTGVVQYPRLEQKVVELIRSQQMTERVLLSSFNHYSLRTVKRIDPRFRIGLLYMCGMVEPWLYANRMGASAIQPYYPNVIPELMAGCHANRVMVSPYLIDDIKVMKAMAAMGVDAVITNHPDRMRLVLAEL